MNAKTSINEMFSTAKARARFMKRTMAAAAISAASLLGSHAQAANKSWDTTGNPNGNFSGAANWTVGATPTSPGTSAAVSGDSLYFGASTVTALTNDLSGASFAGFTFNSGAAAFTIGGNSFTLAGNVTNNSTSLQTFSNAITLSGTNTLTTTTGGGSITLNGVISGSSGLTLAGNGTVTLSNTNNTYTGATTVNGGTLVLNSGGGNSAVRGILNINSGATVSLTAGDALGYNGGSNNSPTININGGTLNNATNSNQGYQSNVVLTGGTMTSTGGGSFTFVTGFGIASNASSTTSLISAPVTIRSGQSMSINVASGTTSSGTDLSITGALNVNSEAGGGITKSGAGLLALSGANTYTGATTINQGTIKLDFSSSAAATNIINSTGNNSALKLGGGTLSLTGKASTTNSQQFNGLTVNGGGSSVVLNANATANPLLLSLGAITRTAGVGGTVDFTLPTGTQSATNGITTTNTNTNGTLLDFTVGGNDWAAKNTLGGTANIISYTANGGTYVTAGTTASAYTSANVDVTSSVSAGGAITPNTLRFNTATPATLGLLAGSTDIVSSGGILVTSNVGSNNTRIAGGTLEGSNNGSLDIIQNSSGTMTISSVIANNSAATGLNKSGAGTLVLTGANSYTGTTTVSGGTLQNGNGITTSGLSGAITLAGGALIINSTGNNSAIGGITLTANSTIGNISGNGWINGGNGINANGFTLTYAGNMAAVAGLLGSNGYAVGNGGGILNGQWYQNGTVSNAAQINIVSGAYAAGSSNVFGSAPINVSSGATLSNWGGQSLANNITLNGGGGAAGMGAIDEENGGTGTYSGNITLASGVTSLSPMNGNMSFTGVVTGAGGLAKTNSGTVTLSNANTYTGVTIVDGGTLQLNLTSTASNSTLYNGVTANTLTLGGQPAAYGYHSSTNTDSPTLSVTGAASTNNTQSFANTVASYGLDTITATPGSSGGIVLNLGTLTHNAGAYLNFTNTTPISAPSATNAVTAVGTGLNNGIIGGWATVGGTDWATLNGSNQIVAYSAYTTTTNAIATGSTTNVKASGTALTTSAGTTDINSLVMTGGTSTTTLGGTLRLGTQGGILDTANNSTLTFNGGTLTAGGPVSGTAGEIVLNGAANNTTWTINSVIANNNALTGAANSTGGGAVTVVFNQGNTNSNGSAFNGANTYSGGTYILNGRLVASSGGFGAGVVTVMNGGEAYLNGGTWANNFAIEGVGGNENSGRGALRAQGATINGTVTLLADAKIGAQGGTGTFNGQITGTGSLQFGDGGSIVLGNTGTGANANNWTGNTEIDINVFLAASNQLPSGSSAGNLYIGNGAGLYLQGFNQTINGLVGNSTSTYILDSTNNTTSVVTVGANNISSTYIGQIQNNGAGSTNTVVQLVKTGTGILALTNTSNSYTGNTVNGGTLQQNGAGSLGGTTGALTVNTGGTLDLNNTSLTVGALSGTGGVISSYTNGTASALTLTAGDATASTTFSGSIQNGTATSISLVKNGTGLLDLNGVNTYTGTTAINAGTLELGNGGSLANMAGLSFGGSTASLALGDAGGANNLTLAAPITGTVGTNSIVNGNTIGASTLTLNGAGGQTYANAFGGSTATSKNLNLIIAGTSTPISVLSGTSTYTGTTTVNSGSTLNLTGALGATAVTVNSGATLTGAGNGTTSGLIGGTLNAVGGSAITLSATTGQLKTTGAVALGTAGTYNSSDYTTLNYTVGGSNAVEALNTAGLMTANNVFVNITNPSQTGTFTLANYGSLTALSAGINGFSLSSSSPGVLTQNLGRNSETLTIGGTSLTLVITGAGAPNVAYFNGGATVGSNTSWNNLSDPNFVNFSTNLAGTNDAGNVVGATSDVILNANNAATNVGTSTITETLGTSTTINSLRVNGNATTTIGADGSNLTINALADANTDTGGGFTGNTAGVGIAIANAANAFTINAPVALGGNQSWTNNSANLFTVGGSVTGKALTATTLTLANTGAGGTTISGVIADGTSPGTLALIVNNTGAGVTTISNASNTYSGGTTLNGGTLTSAVAGGFGAGSVTVNPTNATSTAADNATMNTTGSIASTAAVTVNTEASDGGFGIGTINFNSSTPTIGSLSGNGKVVLNNAGGTTLTIGNATNNLSGSFSGAISQGAGTGSLIKAGSGTEALLGVNTYSGSTTINAGTLQINSSSSLGNGSASNTIAMNGATLESLSGTNTLVANQAFTLTGANTITTDAGLLTINGNVSNGSGLLTFTGAGNTTTAGNVGSGAGGITQSGSGKVTLSGNNSFTGATVVNSGTLNYGGTPTATTSSVVINGTGAFQLGSTTGIAATTSVSFGANTAAKFQLNGNNFTSANAIQQGQSNNIIENGGAINATLTVNNSNGATFGYNELLQDGSGGGTLALDVTGGEYLRLTNNNTFSGGTTLEASSAVEVNTNTVFGTGTVTFNGGSFQPWNNNNLTIANNIVVNNVAGNGINANNGKSFTLTGAFSGAGAITINGNGQTIALGSTTNNNAYSGNATISGSTIQFNNAASGSNAALWTVNGATTLNFSGGTIHFGGLSGNSSGTIGNTTGQTGTNTIVIGERNDASDTFAGTIGNGSSATVAVTKNGTGAEIFSGANTYTGATLISGGVLQLGAGGTTGTLATTSAITDNASLTINRSNAVVQGTDFSSAAITGSGSFTQSGTGTTTLNVSNTYAGSTTVTAGELDLNAASNAISSNLVVNGGVAKELANNQINNSNSVAVSSGSFNIGSFTDTVSGVKLTGGSIAGSTGVLTSTSTYDMQLGTVSAILGGSVGLTKSTTGTVALSGANVFTGATAINGGVLDYQSAGAVGNTSGIAVALGATMQLDNAALTTTPGLSLVGTGAGGAGSGALEAASGTNSFGGVITLTGSSTITFNGSSTLALSGGITNNTASTLALGGTGTGSSTISGSISNGSGATKTSLNVSAGGTWVLSGANTFSGDTNMNNGTLQLNHQLALQNSTFIAPGSSLVFSQTVAGNAFTLGGLNDNNASGSGALTLQNDLGAAIALSVGNNNSYQTFGAGGGTLAGSGSVIKVGTGTWILQGSNSFTGGATSANGILQADVDGAFGSTAATANGGSLSFLDGGTYSMGLNLNGTGYNNNGALVINGDDSSTPSGASSETAFEGAINVATNATLNSNGGIVDINGGLAKNGTTATFTGGGIFNVNSVISGASANSDLVVNGGTTMVLNSVNTYNGPTTIYGNSTIQNGVTNALPTGTVLNQGNAGDSGLTNTYDLNGTNQTVAAVNSTNDGSNSNIVTNNGGSLSTLTLTGVDGNSNPASSNYGGSIQDGASPVALTVSGGTHTLSGVNSYSGTTTISAGTLYITGSTNAVGAVSVASGASLGGTGSTGIVAVAGGGHIALQDGTIGTLTVAGLTSGNLGTPSSFSFDIQTVAGTTSVDQINALGTLTLNGTGGTTISIGNVIGTSTLVNGAYSLITYTGAQQSLSGLTLSTLSLDGHSLSLSQTGDVIYLNVGSGITNGQYALTTTAASLNVHAGGGTTTLATTIANTGTGSQDALNYSGVTATAASGTVGAASGNTSGTNLAQGANNNPGASQTFTAGSAGNVAIGNTASVSNVTASGTPAGSSAGTTINVYSGLSTWAGTGTSGAWGTLAGTGAETFGANWGTNQGSPGVTAGFTGVDTATFASVSGNPANYTVNLNNAAPNLNQITFNAPNTSYTLAQGSGSNSITLSGTTPSINVTAGSHVISAPVILGANTSLATSSSTQLNISGAISGGSSLTKTGAGAAILSNSVGNTYTGGTTVSGGKLYVINSTGSGTGTGAVAVTGSTAQLDVAGNGKVSGAVTLSSGGSLYSGGVPTGTPTTGSGSGVTLTSALNVNGGNLTFALSNGGSGGTIANPLTTSTYLSLSGGATINFTGTDSITLVDLSNGGLSLRQNNAYLLVSASSNAAYSGLVTQSTSGVISLDGNGLVLGVYNGSGPIGSNYVAFSFNEFGADGVTPLNSTSTAGNGYYAPSLYLFNGNLEVVPEPGTWALMIGSLALLIVIQRRRNKVG